MLGERAEQDPIRLAKSTKSGRITRRLRHHGELELTTADPERSQRPPQIRTRRGERRTLRVRPRASCSSASADERERRARGRRERRAALVDDPGVASRSHSEGEQRIEPTPRREAPHADAGTGHSSFALAGSPTAASRLVRIEPERSAVRTKPRTNPGAVVRAGSRRSRLRRGSSCSQQARRARSRATAIEAGATDRETSVDASSTPSPRSDFSAPPEGTR